MSAGWRLRRALTGAVAALAIACVAAPARAAALPGPAELTLGMADGTLFEQSPAPVQSFWLARARALGATEIRLDASWVGIAPGKRPSGFNAADPSAPGYEWATLDANVRAAAAHGESVLLLVQGAPTWASGPHRPRSVEPAIWMPNAADFGAFAHAIARRYSGHFPDPLNPGRMLPRVRYFQAWNEPNLPLFLLPQWAKTGNGPWRAVSPGIYRGLLNAFYSGVKSVESSDVVLSAATGPYGDPPGTGQGRMAPVTFLEGLFCLSPRLAAQRCPDPPHLDVLDHHPYAITPTVSAKLPGDISVPDLGKIWRILAAAQRAHHVLPAGPKPLWVSEIDWTSGHPDTPASQARYLALAFYELWRQGVSHIFWYTLRDPPEPPNSYYDAGLYYYDGTAKPAVAAYSFPFVALRLAPGHLTIWGRAPHAGAVSIQKLTPHGWRQATVLGSTRGGIFYAVRKLGSATRWRAVSGGATSPVWTIASR